MLRLPCHDIFVVLHTMEEGKELRRKELRGMLHVAEVAGGVILAPCPPPGLCPAGFLATGDRRRVCAVEHTPMAGPAGVALAGPVVGAGVLCFRARKTFFHKTSPFFFLG